MVLHVIHALEQLRPDAHRRRRRPRRRAGHQEGPGAGAGVGQRRVRRAGRAARHRRRRRHRHDGVPRRRPRRRLDRSSSSPATRRCCGPRRSTSSSPTHVANGSAATLLTSVLDDPTGYGRVITRAPTGGCCASSSSATPAPDELADRRGRHEHLRLPPRPARPGAAPPLARQRPGRVLPHRRRRRARRDGPPRRPRAGAGRGDPGRQRPLAAGPRRARAARRARTATGCSTASRCSIPARRSSTSPCSSAATSRCTRARSCEGNTVVGDGSEIGPDTRLDDCVVGRGLPRSSTPSALEAEIGDGARVGPYAHLPAGSHVAEGAVTGAFYTAPHGLRRREPGAADGEGHHQEAGAVLGADPSRARRRGRRATSASSSATRTSSSSPTARCGPGSPRASAATTCSSCRRHYGIDGRSVNDSIMEQLIMSTPPTGRRPSGSPPSARSTATPARTARPRVASRSRPASSPTCSRPPAPSG